MANTTWANVEIIAPELSTVPVAAQNLFLADVALEITLAVWADVQEKAQRYLVAHLSTLYLQKSKSNVGGISGKTVGEVSISFSKGTLKSESRLDETSYGREFMRMLNNTSVAFRFITP